MYGCYLVFNSLKRWGIYRVSEKLVVSSRYAQNLPDSVDSSVLSIYCTKLAITVQSDRSNGLKFEL